MASYYQTTTYPFPGCGALYGGANNNNIDCVPNVNDNAANASEKAVISNSIQELIARYGSTVAYYVNTYNLSGANNVYGEDPTSIYAGPTNILMYIQLDESTSINRRFGFDNNDIITAYVHISSYQATFSSLSTYAALSQAVEPKAGDVFQLIQYGADRPGDRNGKFFRISERLDQDVGSGINILGGHYLWKLRAVRYDFSFEPGLSGEAGAAQVFDSMFSGLLSGGMQLPSKPKSYPGGVDKKSKDVIYDQSTNNTSIYGDYGYNGG